MNKRIEVYIILGIYFAMGLALGYSIGKNPEKTNYCAKSSSGEDLRLRVRKRY